MAHSGRLYKLQFRRDLHLDLKNPFGYPECFLIALANLGTPFGNFSFSDTFSCVDLLTSNQPPMIWASPWTVVLSHMYRLTLTIDDPAITLGKMAQAHYKLEEMAAGVVLNYDVSFALVSYNHFLLNANLGSGTLATGYTWTNFFCTLQGIAADWSVYP